MQNLIKKMNPVFIKLLIVKNNVYSNLQAKEIR
jgi:hypothetical protein